MCVLRIIWKRICTIAAPFPLPLELPSLPVFPNVLPPQKLRSHSNQRAQTATPVQTANQVGRRVCKPVDETSSLNIQRFNTIGTRVLLSVYTGYYWIHQKVYLVPLRLLRLVSWAVRAP